MVAIVESAICAADCSAMLWPLQFCDPQLIEMFYCTEE